MEPTLFAADAGPTTPAATAVAAAATDPRWTKAQRAVIEHVEGDLLVSAAAGSGKTAVLAERCARLVTMDDPRRTDVDRLLVLTFTDAAAAEMRARIARAIGQKILALRGEQASTEFRRKLFQQSALIDRAGISTLHAFCARTLRNYFHDVGLDPAFEILDEEEARLLRDEVLDELLAGYHQLPEGDAFAIQFSDFYEAYGQGRDSTIKGFIGAVHAMLASVKSPAQWLAEARDAYSAIGAPRLLDQYAGRVADQLELLRARCVRNISDLRRDGLDVLAQGLVGFNDLLAAEAPRLKQDPGTVWDSVAAAIHAFEFARINRPKEFPAEVWDRHKEFTLGKLKNKLDALKRFTFALPYKKLLCDLLALAGPLEVLIRMTLDFQKTYNAIKQQQNRLDFSDLERMTLDLLCKPESAARDDLRQRYEHILVDEFQDINPLQAAVLDALRSPLKHHQLGNLFVVGDIKQSIYGFRLAEPRLFGELEKQLRHTKTHQACIYLQNNFRSLPPLLEGMNALFSRLLTPSVAGIDYQKGHQLHPPENGAAPKTVTEGIAFGGVPIELHLALTDQVQESEAEEDGGEKGNSKADDLTATEREAHMVAQRIGALMRTHHCVTRKSGQTGALRHGDIAILLRGMKNRAHIFARALAEANIPVHADLSTGYFDAQEVRDTLSLLETLDNPLQDIPLTATMLSHFGGFTHDDLARIRLAYGNRTQMPFHLAVPQYLVDHSTGNTGRMPVLLTADADLAARLKIFFDMLARYRTITRHHPLHEALAEIYRHSGIATYVSGLPAGQQRVANLQMLHQRALQFSGFRKQGLYRFLKFIERLRDAEGDYGEAPVLSEASDVVRIMSIHKSKGLEFPVVIVASLGTKFNIRDGGPVQVHRDLHVALQVADVPKNIFYHSAASKSARLEAERFARAEELRLLYVALTRARDHLILTGTAKRSELDAAREHWTRHNSPLPEDALLDARSFLDWILPVAAGSELGATWPGDSPRQTALAVHIHEPAAPLVEVTNAAAQKNDAAKIMAREPIDAGAPDEVVQALIDRLEGRYPYAALTGLAALKTVTELKTRDQLIDASDDPTAQLVPDILPLEALAKPAWLSEQRPKSGALSAPDAAARGIATHRFLQLLNFASLASHDDLRMQLDVLIARQQIGLVEAAMINLEDVAWFLFQQPLGEQLRTMARAEVGPAASRQLFREIAFTHTLDPGDGLAADGITFDRTVPTSPLDCPQVRGIIDVLLVAPDRGQIIDYKTDHSFAVNERLPGYQRQMRYYMRAAADILKRPVSVATLVFLSARRVEEVNLK